MTMANQVEWMRYHVERELLPDTCQVYPKTGANATISGPGILTSDTPAAKTWRGGTDIPCRPDLSRAFRPGRLKTQTSEIDEYNLELPYDAPIAPSDVVVLSDGRRYEILKVKAVSDWLVTIECLIEEIGVGLDD